MATIVFAGGHELQVIEDQPTVIQRVSAAAAGSDDLHLSFTDASVPLIVKGWFAVTGKNGTTVPVRPETVAYIMP